LIVGGIVLGRNFLTMDSALPVDKLALPLELRRLVVSYITAPNDLRSLCLTCKDFHYIAREFLYKRISLSVIRLNERLSNSFNSQNQSLKYVRYLELKELQQSFIEHVHGKHVVQLLRTIPRDKLEHIYVNSASEMTSTIDNLVFHTQSKLRLLVFHAGSREKLPFALAVDIARNLTAVSLFIKTAKDIRRYMKPMEKLPNLKDLSLTIMTFFLEHDRQKWPCPSINVVRGIFYQTPALLLQPRSLKLSRLYLDGFDFWNWGVALVDALDLTCLQELAMLARSCTWTVWERLAQSQVNLTTLTDDRFESWQPAGSAVGHLCERFRGLRTLKRTFQPLDPAGPADSKGIASRAAQSHSETLEILHLDDALNEEDSWSADSHRSMADFRTLCNAFTQLQQLAIRPPNDVDNPESFAAFLNCLKHPKTLASLKPYVRSGIPDGDEIHVGSAHSFEDLVDAKMQELSQRVFSELYGSCPRPAGLVLHVKIGQNEHGVEVRGEALEFGFFRHMEYDTFGRKAMMVLSCDAHHLRYHAPANDIFFEYTDEIRHMKHATTKTR
jgi:hypothetical protein